MNYRLFWIIISLHIVFIIAGYFVLHYSVFLLLSQTLSVRLFGYVFLITFLSICICIHYLVVDMHDVRTSITKKWALSVGSMCFSTIVAFLFLAFLF